MQPFLVLVCGAILVAALTIDKKSFQGGPIKDSLGIQAFCPAQSMTVGNVVTKLH
jgi:hypothetical protein